MRSRYFVALNIRCIVETIQSLVQEINRGPSKSAEDLLFGSSLKVDFHLQHTSEKVQRVEASKFASMQCIFSEMKASRFRQTIIRHGECGV